MIKSDEGKCDCQNCCAARVTIQEEAAQAADQSWAQTYCEGNWREHEKSAALTSWIRENRHAREIMMAFPPECLVRARPGRHLEVPAPGMLAIVKAYGEPKSGRGPWGVAIQTFPGSRGGAYCRADDLELVMPWRGLTPEVIASLMSDA